MRIAIATDTYHPNVNGASYFTQRLAFYLGTRGHTILVVAPSRRARHESYVHEGARVFGIRSIPVWLYKDFRVSPPFFVREIIEEALKEFAPDVVHLQGHFFLEKTVLGAAQSLGIPTVGTNHFMPENLCHYLHLPRKGEEWVKSWGWRNFCSVFEKVDIVTTPTETAARLLREIGLRKPVYPVSCGIDTKRFNPQNRGEYLRKRYKVPERGILLYVGRLDREKNLDSVLRALAMVPETTGVHLVIAGTGAEGGRLKELVRDLDLESRVSFVGFVPDEDLPNLYSIADCFIIAGTAELQSIVTMEAMASGLPIIAVRAMALPELVRHDENGYLFQPGDEIAAAEFIIQIFSDELLRKRMGQKSLELIRKHDIKQTMKSFELIYHALKRSPISQARIIELFRLSSVV